MIGTVRLATRGEARCGVIRGPATRPHRCPEPAAVIWHVNDTDLPMCQRCWDDPKIREPGDPLVADLRFDAEHGAPPEA
jgi:hypothetical protein